MKQVDVIIVGQGLAGTALAWQLLRRGRSVFIVDREPPVTSSRIAAGLLTPITGKRLAVSWNWHEFLPTATAFYRDIESTLSVEFFHALPCVRLFAYEIEQKQFRKHAEEFAQLATVPDPPLNDDWFDASRGAFQMPTAARLDTQTYLDASRLHFQKLGCYQALTVDPDTDIEATLDVVRLRPENVIAKRLVFCQGFTGLANRYFPDVVFNAAKGEILTLRIPGLIESRVINRGVWLAPDGGELFRVGATYSWDPLDCVPSAEGRKQLHNRLATFVKLPVEVVDHTAAVRPIIDDRQPVILWSPALPRIGFFNGLGSKGSLQAPHFAELCAKQCATEPERP